MAKLIIIEGLDNTGKNTLIQQVLEQYNFVSIKHCTKPKSVDPEMARQEQQQIYDFLFLNDIKQNNILYTDVIIHNRSYYGEYVYGVMYRQNTDEWTKHLVSKLEKGYIEHFGEDNIYFVTLLAHDINVIVRNEDGKSLSAGKIEKIEVEKQRFIDIFNYSSFKNKHIIYIDKDGQFRSREDICNEFLKFINIK